MNSVLKLVGGLVMVALIFAGGYLFRSTGVGQAVDPASLADHERAFTERMQNVVLVGNFTIDGRGATGHPERYEIERVVKIDDNRWRFDTHMVYGSTDVTLPIAVPIEWAGDTPVVSITDFSIPGLDGTFTARVMFYDNRYAGSWQHGDYEGLMYGNIER